MAPYTASDLERARRALRGFLERLVVTLVALAVSTLPERVKREGWPAAYASAAAHVFSGWVEVVISVGVFGVGFLKYVSGFMEGAGGTFLLRKPGTLSYGDFFGMGALGYLSYLFTPIAWVTLYCLVEGVLRALDAAFSERMLGVTLVALPWHAVAAVRRRTERRRTEELLGPERPDEVVLGEPGASVAVTIFAAREKPWTAHQAIEYLGDFYTVADRRLETRGLHHVYRYDLHHFRHGEVIRGMLIRYEPKPVAPAPGPPAPSPE